VLGGVVCRAGELCNLVIKIMGFPVTMKITVVWYVMPCNLVDIVAWLLGAVLLSVHC
jgi:hypothetical protein